MLFEKFELFKTNNVYIRIYEMEKVKNCNQILLKRKEITEKYSYNRYTLPRAPDLPPITPRRKLINIINYSDFQKI